MKVTIISIRWKKTKHDIYIISCKYWNWNEDLQNVFFRIKLLSLLQDRKSIQFLFHFSADFFFTTSLWLMFLYLSVCKKVRCSKNYHQIYHNDWKIFSHKLYILVKKKQQQFLSFNIWKFSNILSILYIDLFVSRILS